MAHTGGTGRTTPLSEHAPPPLDHHKVVRPPPSHPCNVSPHVQAVRRPRSLPSSPLTGTPASTPTVVRVTTPASAPASKLDGLALQSAVSTVSVQDVLAQETGRPGSHALEEASVEADAPPGAHRLAVKLATLQQEQLDVEPPQVASPSPRGDTAAVGPRSTPSFVFSSAGVGISDAQPPLSPPPASKPEPERRLSHYLFSSAPMSPPARAPSPPAPPSQPPALPFTTPVRSSVAVRAPTPADTPRMTPRVIVMPSPMPSTKRPTLADDVERVTGSIRQSLQHAALVLSSAPPAGWAPVAPQHLLTVPGDTSGSPTRAVHRVARLGIPSAMDDTDIDRAVRRVLHAADDTERRNVTGLQVHTHRWCMQASADAVSRQSVMRPPTPGGRRSTRQALGPRCEVVGEAVSSPWTDADGAQQHWTFVCPTQTPSADRVLVLLVAFACAPYTLPSGVDAGTVWAAAWQRAAEEAGVMLLSVSQVTPLPTPHPL